MSAKKNWTIKLTDEISYNDDICSSIDDSIIIFKDTNFETLIRFTVNKPIDNIYKSDVSSITSLSSARGQICDISGIENLTNLQSFDLSYTKISLKDLNELKTALPKCDITYKTVILP